VVALTGCTRSKPPPPPKAPAPVAAKVEAPPAPGTYAARLKAAGYVGSEVCADCHPDVSDTFVASAMARSVTRPGVAGGHPPAASGEVVHRSTGLHYEAVAGRDTVRQTERRLRGGRAVFEEEHAAELVIGSGAHTRSYLAQIRGALRQLPLTFYTGTGQWDMSPGYAEQNARFGRVMGRPCLFCHTLTPELPEALWKGGEKRWLGIGCERCHGPGRDHVEDAEAHPLYHPGERPFEQAIEICEQCHLPGAARVFALDWDGLPPDPREPIDRVLSIYVEADPNPDAPASVADQAARLRLSRCFTESAGKLRCTSCHDPHMPAKANRSRAACQGCHTRKPCSRPAHQAAEDSTDCVGCHLRKIGARDIPHTSFTDHFIRRRVPKVAPKLRQAGDEKFVVANPEAGLRPTHPPRGIDAGEARARLAAARLSLANQTRHEPTFFAAKSEAEAAVSAAPDNALALLTLGAIHLLLEEGQPALDALSQAVQGAPRSAEAWGALSQAHQQIGDVDSAITALTRARALSEQPEGVLVQLSRALMKAGRAEEARLRIDEALELRPSYGPTRRDLAALLAQTEDGGGALAALVEDCRRTLCSVETWVAGAKMLEQTEHGEQAIALLDTGLKEHPDDRILNQEAARLEVAAEKLEDAVDRYGVLFDKHPEDFEYATKLAGLLFDVGQAAKAAEVYEASMKSAGRTEQLLRKLAVARGVAGEFKAADKLLREAIAAGGGKNAETFNELAMLRIGDQDYRGAVKVLRRALKVDPEFAFSWFNLAMCLNNLGESADALAAVETGLRFAPEDEQALTLRRTLRIAVHGTAPGADAYPDRRPADAGASTP